MKMKPKMLRKISWVNSFLYYWLEGILGLFVLIASLNVATTVGIENIVLDGVSPWQKVFSIGLWAFVAFGALDLLVKGFNIKYAKKKITHRGGSK